MSFLRMRGDYRAYQDKIDENSHKYPLREKRRDKYARRRDHRRADESLIRV